MPDIKIIGYGAQKPDGAVSENTVQTLRRAAGKIEDIGKSVSPIFPIMIRDNKKVYEIAKMLQEKGIFTICLLYTSRTCKRNKDVQGLSCGFEGE